VSVTVPFALRPSVFVELHRAKISVPFVARCTVFVELPQMLRITVPMSGRLTQILFLVSAP